MGTNPSSIMIQSALSDGEEHNLESLSNHWFSMPHFPFSDAYGLFELGEGRKYPSLNAWQGHKTTPVRP